MDLLGRAPVRVEPLDPRGQPWRVIADEWTAVLRRFSPKRYRPESSLEHIAWLHRFLDRLAPSGFPAPKPLPILNGGSIAVVDGAIWEALSYLQGRPLAWSPGIALQSAGAILARFHKASLAVGCPEQRPGALPMEDCYPLSAPQIAETFQRNLQEIGHQSAARCVLHGDCTSANMLVDDGAAVVGLIDFTLAHVGPLESDISFALWVTGRTAQPEIALDPERVRAVGSHQSSCLPLASVYG